MRCWRPGRRAQERGYRRALGCCCGLHSPGAAVSPGLAKQTNPNPQQEARLPVIPAGRERDRAGASPTSAAPVMSSPRFLLLTEPQVVDVDLRHGTALSQFSACPQALRGDRKAAALGRGRVGDSEDSPSCGLLPPGRRPARGFVPSLPLRRPGPSPASVLPSGWVT